MAVPRTLHDFKSGSEKNQVCNCVIPSSLFLSTFLKKQKHWEQCLIPGLTDGPPLRFFPVATFYWLAHFAILTKLQCCCMTMAWYWWCSTNQNRFSELVILIRFHQPAAEILSMCRKAKFCMMFVNVYNQKEATQRLVLQIWGTRFRNLQIQ